MTENFASETTSLIDDLRKIEVFSDLPQEQLAWLAEKFEKVHLQPGEIIVRDGDPADWLLVMLEGEIRFQRDGVPDAPVFTMGAGRITGLLPFSRLTTF